METNSEELASRLSYEVVKEVAPDELDLFNDIKEEFLKKPDAFLEKDTKKREKMLGFALPPGAEQFITMFVLPVVFKLIDKYLGKKETVGKLDANKIKKLREDAYQNAMILGMDKEKAAVIADSLVGKIAQMGY